MQYTFDTKALFLLGQMTKHFQEEIDGIVGLLPSLVKVQQGADILEIVDPEQLMGILSGVISKSVDAEDLMVQFLSNASRLTEQQVRDMDGYTFLEELKAAFMAIDWKRLMGKSLGLTLSPPQSQSGAEKNQKKKPLTPSKTTSEEQY